MKLTDIIIKKIREKGPISFHDFMEMALYYPGLGYYTSCRKRIGKEGDYYTSPVLSSLYGQMVAKQIEEMWGLLGQQPMSIVEFGAGTCDLCLDILSYLKNNDALYSQLKYFIIEKNSLQYEQNLPEDKVELIDDIERLKGINGCILSNEVIDNFPVNVVIMKNELWEVFVDYHNDFTEVLKPASRELYNYLREQDITLPENCRTEINLAALEWIKKIATSLNEGFVITVDYGYSSRELYAMNRSTGTLACYHNHKVTDSPYCNIGEQDITAHVNFSALKIWGEKYGLEYTGFCNQNYFLRSMGLADHLRKIEKGILRNNKALFLNVNRLLLEMGSNFKILIQQKGIETGTVTGMQFSGLLS